MARAQKNDFLQNFRFFVTILGFGDPGGDKQLLGNPDAAPKGGAGFNACTAPEISGDLVEYREGHYVYSRKFPGIPKTNDITLSRGVSFKDSTFYKWVKKTLESGEEYRATMIIKHLSRTVMPATQSDPIEGFDASAAPNGYIQYTCNNAIPKRVKLATDFSSTSGEVSMAELEVGYETVKLEEFPPA